MLNNFNILCKPSNDIKVIKRLVNRSLGIDMHTIHEELSDFDEISSQISNDLNMNSEPKKGTFTLCSSKASCHETNLKNRMQSSYNNISAIVNAMYPIETNAIKCDKQLYSEHKIDSQESVENKDSPEYCRKLQYYISDYNMPTQQEDVNEVLESSIEYCNLSTVDMFQNKCDEIEVTNEFASISSTYENNLNSTFMTQNFNVLSSNHIESSSNNRLDGDISEIENNFTVSEFMKNNHDVVTEKTASDETNSKNSLICISVKGEKTDSSNDISGEENKLENMPFSNKSKGNNKNAKHICSQCSKCFRYPSELKRHINSHKVSKNISEHEEINELSGIVSKMERNNNRDSDKTSDPPKIEKHKAKCVQICPFCSRVFKFASKLARHIKTHTDLKPYECHFCSKTFLERFNLRTHLNMHKNEMAYVCNICLKSFNFKSNLTRHLRSHMKDKQFFCHDCGDAYSSEKMLAIHIRNHEEKPYKCTDCIKAFKKKTNLKRHLEIHSNKKRMYICHLCDYAATRNSHLKRHIARHHTK